MKKLFPETPDVSQSVANKAAKIVEKHLRMHRVSRARDLPEEARLRLYRDLRFFFESGSQPPRDGMHRKGFSVWGSVVRLWEKLEDFLSASETYYSGSPTGICAWVPFGDWTRMTLLPRRGGEAACEGTD